MPAYTDDEHSVFLDPRDFGTRLVLHLAKSGEMRGTVGIFDENHAGFDPNRWPGSQYQMQSGAKFSTAGPHVECRTVAVKGVRQRDTVNVEVNGELQAFRVQDIKPDGLGITVLILVEADEETK